MIVQAISLLVPFIVLQPHPEFKLNHFSTKFSQSVDARLSLATLILNMLHGTMSLLIQKVLLHICNSKLFSVHPPDGPTLIPSVGQPSVVDFVLSKEIYSIKDPKVLNDLSSDHMPIIFDIPLNVSAHKDIRIFNFAKANWKGFKSQLSIESMKLDFLFPTLNSPHSIEKCISGLEKNIHEAMNKNIPKKLPYRFKYPYSNDLHLMTKERNRLRKLFLNTGNAGYKSAK